MKKNTSSSSVNTTSSYLQKIQFKSSDFSSLLKNYITNMRLVALVLIFLIFGGAMAYINIPQTLNPEIDIAVVSVTTLLPGATPTDVESLVTEKIEKEVAKVDKVDVITSTSRESVSSVIVQFKDGVNRDAAQTDVQNAVGTIATLPADAQTPQVKAFDFEDTPIMQYAIVGKNIDQASLNSFADAFVADLEDIESIDRVEISGNEEQEVQILITESQLKELGVNLTTVATMISGSIGSYPSGQIYTENSAIGLTIDRASMTLEQLRAVVISINDVMYRLGDIAEVAERSAPGYVPAFFTTSDGQENTAITFDVYRILGSKVSDVNEQALDMIATYQELAGENIMFVKITNMNDEIQESFNNLYQNLSVTVLLVFCVLFLFVGVRQAFLAALSVPLVFMTAFIVMFATGMTLNFLSIFSLLLALGLLVDVTIVVISAITTYYRSGQFTPREAALLVWKDYFTTLLVTTLTTVWAFIPLLLASGIIGSFIKPLPIVVSSVLIGSVFVGFFIILPLMVWSLDFFMPRRTRIFFAVVFIVLMTIVFRQIILAMGVTVPLLLWIVIIPIVIALCYAIFVLLARLWDYAKSLCKKRLQRTHQVVGDCTEDGIIKISRLAALYQHLLDVALQQKKSRRTIVGVVVLFFFFSVSLVGFGFVQNEFFPEDDATLVYVSIELPLDTRARVSEKIAKEFVEQILDTPGMTNIQTQIGAQISGDGNVVLGVAPSNILITVNLTDAEDRDISSVEIAQNLRTSDAVQQFNKGEIIISELGGGPPAGADVTIKFLGDDLVVLDTYANQVMDFLNNTPGTINIKKSVDAGSSKVSFVPDQNQLMSHGISVQEVGSYLRTFGSGLTVSEDIDFEDLTDSRDIIIRLSSDIQTIDALENLSISTSDGSSVPLTTLGSFVLKQSPIKIEREDMKRELTVTAAVADGYNATIINQNVGTYIDNDIVLAQGYSWKSGGANEENQKSINSILQAMVLAVILIFLTLIIQLNSYRKSFIVLLVIPLAISGVFVLFAIFGIPLSFPALIGLLALFGIVINNSIMIIDQINKNHAENLPFHQAVVEGAASRLEPILLSSLTTIAGLAPITITQPVWQGLGGAIISGLVFSGVIMLFFIPSVYYMMMEADYIDKK